MNVVIKKKNWLNIVDIDPIKIYYYFFYLIYQNNMKPRPVAVVLNCGSADTLGFPQLIIPTQLIVRKVLDHLLCSEEQCTANTVS